MTRKLLVAALVLAVAVAAVLGVRAVREAVYWADPAHRDQPLEGWMTPRYVARSWDLPPETVAEALGLDQDGTGRRNTLDDLARARGVPLSDLVQALDRARAAR